MQHYKHGGYLEDDTPITLDFSINVSPLGQPKGVKQAIIDSLEIMEQYPDPTVNRLREALAQKHALSKEQILCGNGASDLLFRLTAYLQPKRVLTIAPTFSEYERPVKLFGGEVIEYQLSKDSNWDVGEGIFDALVPGVEILFLSNPNNPTGRLIPQEVLDCILEKCQDINCFVVLDECFIEFTMASDQVAKLPHYPNLLILRAFTKFYGLAGLRLGYLLGDEELLSNISAFGPPWNVSSLAQAAGVAALADESWSEEIIHLVECEREFLTTELTGLGMTVVPSQANFLLLQSPIPLYEPLKEMGIHVRDCHTFSGLDETFTRIGFRKRHEHVELINAIQSILKKKRLPSGSLIKE